MIGVPMNDLGFDGIIGQVATVTMLKERIASEKYSPLLLAGPEGAGKLTLARLYAKAILCHSADKPCGICAGCRSVNEHGSLRYIELQARQHNSHRAVREQLQKLSAAVTEPIVLVVREPECLSAPVSDGMLKTLEVSGLKVFVFLAADIMAVSATIRSRCVIRELASSHFDVVYEDLTSICAERGIVYEKRAIEILSRLSDGWIGRARNNLERAINAGPLSVAEILSAFDLARGDDIADCWLALLRGHHEEAYELSLCLGPDCASRANVMLSFVRSFFYGYVIGDKSLNIASTLLTEGVNDDAWESIKREWLRLAEAQSVTLSVSVRRTMTFWSETGNEGLWTPIFQHFSEACLARASAIQPPELNLSIT